MWAKNAVVSGHYVKLPRAAVQLKVIANSQEAFMALGADFFA